MANDGRHAKPKNSVFSKPAQETGRESSTYYTQQPQQRSRPGGYTEYQPRREAGATRYTQRPEPSPARQLDRYTERVARSTTDGTSNAARPVNTNRPSVQRSAYAQPAANYERQSVSSRGGASAARPSPYEERVAARRARLAEEESRTVSAATSRPAARPPRRADTPAATVPPRKTSASTQTRPRTSYKPRKRMDGGLLLAIVLLAALIIFVLAKLFGTPMGKPAEKPADTPVVQVTPTPEATPAPTEVPTATPVPTPEGDPARLEDGRIVPADWGVVVPQRETEQFNSYFDRSVMIGNSLVEGFYMWAGMAENFTFICDANLWVNKVIGGIDLSKVTLNPGKYDSIYLMFGLNEVGNSVDDFIRSYGEVIDFLREYQPTATIYVQSVTPVMEKVDVDPGEVQTKARIENFNEKLKVMCADKGCWYVDLYTMLLDDTGYLSADYAFAGDGKHFEKSGYVAWANYLKTHYVDKSLIPE